VYTNSCGKVKIYGNIFLKAQTSRVGQLVDLEYYP
jgi:hypothetical protein